MNDKQFIEFVKRFDTVMDQKFLVFKEELTETFKAEMRTELTDIRSNIDWIIDALDTDEKERLALIYSNERQFNDHERRISKLELATK